MLVSFIKKMLRNRRGATAVALAIMFVPLVMTAAAAVDLSRIVAAHTLLQASVDDAAVAGVSEWQMSESSTDASGTASNQFLNTGSQLSYLGTGATPTVNLACTGATLQCGGSTAFTKGTMTGCPAATLFEYCVVVTASLTVNNSLLAPWLPSELMSVSAGASSTFASQQYPSGGSKNGQHTTSAGDINSIYWGAVGMSATGVPEYAGAVAPNQDCNTIPGGLSLVTATQVNGVTSCNYYFIADSLNNSATNGFITVAENQPLAFIFVNDTGANGYTAIDSTHYTTNLMISTASSSSGYTWNPQGATVTTAGTICEYGASNCTVTQASNTQLYGQCPAHTLYGSIDNAYGSPQSNGLNVYSSAYELLGYPPTYEVNHVLTPFISTDVVTQTVGGTTYYVKAVCPNYSTTGTLINAPVSPAYSSTQTGDFSSGMNTYATWFPTGNQYGNSTYGISPGNPQFTAFQDNAASVAITGGTVGGTTDIYPPVVAGCSPSTNATDGGVTPASMDSPPVGTGTGWWGWNSSNYGNCVSHQSAAYTNCTLLIQQLGTNVPTNSEGGALLPDYYNIIEAPNGSVLALDPVYDDTTYQDSLTGTTVYNTDPAGYTPTNATPTTQTITNTTTIHGGGTATPYANSVYIGDILAVQEPATGSGMDHNPPQMTSRQCYNPEVAVEDGGYKPSGSTTDLLGYYPYTNNGITIGEPYDPIANPQLGAVVCESDPPETYAVYWNDLGTYGDDDLGYWNSVAAFTCQVPPTSNQGAGTPTLSF